MLRRFVGATIVATVLTLLTTSQAGAWGYGHYGYTHVGYGGAYHVGYTRGYGGYGGYRGYGYGGYRGYGYGGYRGYGYAGGLRYESPYSNGAYAQQAHARMAYR